MIKRVWSLWELEIVRKTYEHNKMINSKEIAEIAYKNLRKDGFSRTKNSIVRQLTLLRAKDKLSSKADTIITPKNKKKYLELIHNYTKLKLMTINKTNGLPKNTAQMIMDFVDNWVYVLDDALVGVNRKENKLEFDKDKIDYIKNELKEIDKLIKN